MYSTLNIEGTSEVCRMGAGMTVSIEPELLDARHTDEALDFLAQRPLNGLFLQGHIEDNGLASPLNRGSFFRVRNATGVVEAVGLIGHATMFEATTEASLQALASVAQQHDSLHMLLGPQAGVHAFWRYLSQDGRRARGSCRELLLIRNGGESRSGMVESLRRARLTDLDLLLPVHAEMARSKSGINPLDIDPEGFRERYQRRLDRDRVWVVIEDDRLIFKADVALQTRSAIYLEGVYVAPEIRGAGCGRRYLSALTDILLERVDSVCLLVNEQNVGAHKMYGNAGFKFEGYYQSIFV
jgi:ribosomal protein S18 acetylase RimI-like enzyme